MVASQTNTAARPPKSTFGYSKRKLPKITTALDKPQDISNAASKQGTHKDGSAIFGEYVAAKLKGFPPHIAAEAELDIRQVLQVQVA